MKEQRANLDPLRPLYSYLSRLGYEPAGDAIEIEGWPVQLLPDFNPLIEEALEEANEIKFQRTKTRVMQSEHLMAIMLQTGRLKDYARLAQFVESRKFDQKKLHGILTRHGLQKKWKTFEAKQ